MRKVFFVLLFLGLSFTLSADTTKDTGYGSGETKRVACKNAKQDVKYDNPTKKVVKFYSCSCDARNNSLWWECEVDAKLREED